MFTLKNTARAAVALAAVFAVSQTTRGASYTWNVASGNWSTPTNWSLVTVGPNGPLAADSVVFGATGASGSSSTVNNIVDSGFAGSITGLTYNSTSASAYNVTQIGSGQTLTVTGPMLVGGQNGVGLITEAYMTGGGTLMVTGSPLTVQNYGSASGANSTAYLNLSGLNNFIYNNPAGTISIEDNPSGLTRLGGNLTLAAVSNYIAVSNLNLGTSTSAQAGPAGALVLGPGANAIDVNTLNLANNKSTFTMSFAAASGSLKLRGADGTDSSRATITVGNRNQTGTGVCAGTMSFNGSPVDIKAGTLTVGANPNTGTTTGDSGVGLVQFDTGTLDATTVIMGTSATASGIATGTISVGAQATLLVGSGGLSLVNQGSSGVATGNLNLATGGTVECAGSITEATATGTGNLNMGGLLSMAEGAFVGTASLPINNVTLSNSATLDLAVSSTGQPNMVAGTLIWPVNDNTLTINIVGLPAGAQINSGYTLIQYTAFNGAFVAPTLNLPAGVSGTLANNGSAIVLTLTGGVGPGIGGINQLANPSFETLPGKSGWISTTNISVITTNATNFYKNGTNGVCSHDATTNLVVSHSGTNVAVFHGADDGSANTNALSQDIATIAGSTWTAGAFTYVSHQDLLAGKNSFYYQANFLDGSGTLLASYQSFIVSNLVCGETAPFPLDTWVLLGVTNEIQVVNGVNTGVVVTNVPSGLLEAPANTASVQFQAVFVQQGGADASDGGSVYMDDANLGLASGPVPPMLSAVSPNGITLCTNTVLTCTASSSNNIITNVQIIATTSALGGPATTVTNSLGSAGLTVAGIGTGTANIQYALTSNTVYESVIVKATDNNGVTVASPVVSFDALTPTLVIEAADFNFSGGHFLDTPPDGGLALYQGQVGVQDIDENKAARSSTQSYYRPNDAVITQPAASTSLTEQKFVTAAADGDTTDVEVEVGYNTPGDWLNYTRSYGSEETNSAPEGIYNVWLFSATSGTGVQSALYQVTSDPTQSGQTTNFLGNFGTASYTNTSYNNFVYLPLVDQYGDMVSVTLSNTATLRSVVVGNPNLGFYILVPAASVSTPTLQTIFPNGQTPFETTNELTFTVSANSGAPISASGITVILNGTNVSSQLVLTQSGSNWLASLAIRSNAVYTAVIDVTNTAGAGASYNLSFDTLNIDNYQWEAVDYDYSTNNGSGWVGGQFIDNPVPSGDVTAPALGYLATNSYFGYPTGFTPGADPYGYGAIAVSNIDVYWPDSQTGTAEYYRADGVGSQPASDFIRPKFVAARAEFSDQNIGPFNIGYYNAGNWLNYTRHYPTNQYNIWGRLAGVNAFSGTSMSLVTSGVGTTNQTTQLLGTFSDPNAGGYQVWHWVPLLDDHGNMASVALGGKATLRVTSGNNLNMEFFMLAPAPLVFSVTPSVAAGQLHLAFPTQTGFTYTLLYKTSLTAAWAPVGTPVVGNGAPGGFTAALTGQQGYYAISAQPSGN